MHYYFSKKIMKGAFMAALFIVFKLIYEANQASCLTLITLLNFLISVPCLTENFRHLGRNKYRNLSLHSHISLACSIVTPFYLNHVFSEFIHVWFLVFVTKLNVICSFFHFASICFVFPFQSRYKS